MSYPSHPLTSITIPISTKVPVSSPVLAEYKTARALSIGAPATLAETITVEGQGTDDAWRTVKTKELADLAIAAGEVILVHFPGRFKSIRVASTTNVAAARVFTVQVISQLD